MLHFFKLFAQADVEVGTAGSKASIHVKVSLRTVARWTANGCDDEPRQFPPGLIWRSHPA
jgi:hypothetical protein